MSLPQLHADAVAGFVDEADECVVVDISLVLLLLKLLDQVPVHFVEHPEHLPLRVFPLPSFARQVLLQIQDLLSKVVDQDLVLLFPKQ